MKPKDGNFKLVVVITTSFQKQQNFPTYVHIIAGTTIARLQRPLKMGGRSKKFQAKLKNETKHAGKSISIPNTGYNKC